MKLLIEPLALILFVFVVWATWPISMVIAAAWIGAGVHMVTSSESRGPLADALFVFSWPLWLFVEG